MTSPKRPERVKIGAHTYQIHWITREEADLRGILGQCFPNDLYIDIREDLPPSKAADTFMHEVLHAINNDRGIEDSSTEEQFVSQAIPGITRFMLDNKEAWEWWQLTARRGAQSAG